MEECYLLQNRIQHLVCIGKKQASTPGLILFVFSMLQVGLMFQEKSVFLLNEMIGGWVVSHLVLSSLLCALEDCLVSRTRKAGIQAQNGSVVADLKRTFERTTGNDIGNGYSVSVIMLVNGFRFSKCVFLPHANLLGRDKLRV